MTKTQLIKLIGLGKTFTQEALQGLTVPRLTEIYNAMLKPEETKVKKFKSKPVAMDRLKGMFAERFPGLLVNGEDKFLLPTVWCNIKDARIRKELCQLKYFKPGSKKCMSCDYFKNILQPKTVQKAAVAKPSETKTPDRKKGKAAVVSLDNPNHCEQCATCIFFLQVSKEKAPKENTRFAAVLKAFKENKGQLTLKQIEKLLNTKYPRQQMHSLKDNFPIKIHWDRFNKVFVQDQ